ncbi:MAG TPA: PhnD/SsuA/transferrin family substrate-binding protein, partial [Gemmataceae bacterium]|nr:PhnD/SsuA/transferrin family substrate-binding protein [Gemmataceae bacterium]
MVRRGTQHIWLVLLALTMTSVVFLPARGEEPEKSKDAVHIGLVNTLFRDTPEALLKVVMEPFGSLMESQTGVHGQLIMAGDAHDLTQRLKDGKIQLGVFNGVEFAWAQQEYPELKPLMIAVCKDPRLHAYIVVRNDSEISSFEDLHQKYLAVPRRSRQHCHLFLRRC